MMLAIVVDNPRSWFVPFSQKLASRLGVFGSVQLLQSAEQLPPDGDVAFLLSCEKKVPASILARSRHNIVVHASDLPQGKGMSPMTWQILEGKDVIPVSLFEAAVAIDAGPVYLKDEIRFQGNELLDEMQVILGDKIVEMCISFMAQYPDIIMRGHPQIGPGSYYRRRSPEDSRLDANRSIADQFNLLRVVDNERYPAYFELRGRRYVLKIASPND